MSVKKILNVRDPVLRKKSKAVVEVDKKVLKLINDLKETLRAQKDPPGVGLAAPQIGVLQRVFIMREKGKIVSIINPEISNLSKKTNDPPKVEGEEEVDFTMEGCLSLAHNYGPVKRSWALDLEYTTSQGEKIKKRLRGFVAQIIQHEVDHLDGKIFVDRLFEQKRQLFHFHSDHWHEVELP